MNRNIHTTSTKWKYNIDASYPKWWCFVIWWFIILTNITNKNNVPIITCSPWNPVATQNVLPYTESAIVNVASQYSIACNTVNINPSATVNTSPTIVSLRFPLIIALCDHVTVAPDDNSIAVFNSGTSNAFNAVIPTGGHTDPISTVGANAEWKNAQKNDTKNAASDTMNRITPNLNPFCTTNVCIPWYVASRITSLHHTAIVDITSTNDNIINISPYKYRWKYITPPTANPNTPADPTIGHGLGFTK